jgi:hypothetical protein
MRQMPKSDRLHFDRRGHFKIQRPGQFLFQPGNIGVNDVPPVFPEVGCNAIRATFDRQLGGSNRVGVRAASGIPNSRDVIDIHAQPLKTGVWR